MNLSLIFKSVLITLACFLLVIIFSFFVFNQSFSPLFDYTIENKVKISTTVNSLATPIISLISVILLYITLSKQIESNYFQKKSKNLDLILVMYNQLQIEYENLSYTKKGTSTSKGITTSYENHFKGADALQENLKSFRIKPEKFGPSYQSDKIIRLINTFTLVENLIYSMDLEVEARKLLIQNINSLYKTNFKPVLLSLAFLIQKNSNFYSKELIEFVTIQERKVIPNFTIDNFEKESDLFKEYYNM